MEIDRPKIHRLPQEIIRLIAAGEVIERPASVVKELIENSLDAESKHIEVRLHNGGLASIAVRDDGHGIPADEVPLLLERHTTSKIDYESDLEAIYTLGFRGEALYSIAAAGDIILSTRHSDEDAGTCLTWADGEKTITTIPWPGGTQVESVRLYHSMPARRKFLRSESAEYGRVASLIQSYALAYPAIGFRLLHNGRETLRTPGSGKLEDVLIAVYGTDIARKMLPVDYESGDIRITGSISPIDITRARRSDQVIFLNGRLIKDPAISATLERPYMQFLSHGRHPIAVLRIECDPTEIDVNVHPHKSEVRLAKPRAITGTVYHAVDSTLRGAHPLGVEKDETKPGYSVDDTTGEVLTLPVDKTSDSSSMPPDEREWAIREPKHRHSSELESALHTPEGQSWAPPAGQTEHRKSSSPDRNLQHQYRSFAEMDIANDLPTEGNAIQFANTYIIYNQGRSIYLIDQHNLHERILFEEFTKRNSEQEVASQALLFPVQVNLPPALSGIVDDHIDVLRGLGFDIEEFSEGSGEKAYVLRAVPQALKSDDPVEAFTDLLESAAEDEELTDEGFGKAFLINLSCKTAIKAGQALTDEEIGYLVSHIGDGTFLTCPHGRPTMIRLDEEWFRRSFKRSR